MSWQDLARSLPFGAKRKVRCCSDDTSSYVSNTPAGIRIGPCFRCGAHEFERHAGASIAQLTRWRTADTEVRGMQNPPGTVPHDQWPANVLVWLGAAGVRPDRAEAMGAGWSPDIDRFILPCLIDNKRTGAFTARLCGVRGPAATGSGGRPPETAKRRPKYVAGGRGLPCWIGGDGPVTVVVEDILSAWRVCWAGYRACAVLGTSFDQAVLAEALRGTEQAVSWLDPDAAGRKAHRKLRRAMGLWDVPLYRVQSERDPKLHSQEEIQRYIEEALS